MFVAMHPDKYKSMYLFNGRKLGAPEASKFDHSVHLVDAGGMSDPYYSPSIMAVLVAMGLVCDCHLGAPSDDAPFRGRVIWQLADVNGVASACGLCATKKPRFVGPKGQVHVQQTVVEHAIPATAKGGPSTTQCDATAKITHVRRVDWGISRVSAPLSQVGRDRVLVTLAWHREPANPDGLKQTQSLAAKQCSEFQSTHALK
ncbi:hypothetical protein JCM3770_003379 [Rhodotorula araucariae]